jgi:hypothetical protein
MEDRISNRQGAGAGANGWDRDAFRQLFPGEERFAIRHGINTPELRGFGSMSPTRPRAVRATTAELARYP